MHNPLRVLLVEDSRSDERLLIRHLRESGYEPIVHRVETRAEMSDALKNGEWNIVISDYRLPQFSGPEALEVLREHGVDLPFIIVSGSIGESNAVAAMRAGVHDYVMKDNLLRLAPVIQREIQEANIRRLRHHAEIALRESEERFRNMADSAPILLWVSDVDHRYTYVNKPWLLFSGRTFEEEIGMGWMDLLHPDDVPVFSACEGKAVADRQSYQTEHRLKRHDGDWRWMLDTGSPRFQANGVFAGYIGICLDVTERKQEEMEREKMRAENEKLLQEKALAALQQRAFLKEMLYSITEGKLSLCYSRDDLPQTSALELIGATSVSRIAMREARVLAEAAARNLGFSEPRKLDLVTAVAEAGMNAVVHAGGGEARVYAGKDVIQVWVQDRGSGIDVIRLPRATLERGYTTANSLGHGFFMMLNSADRLYLLTGPDGTTVVIEQNRVPPEPAWLAGA